ncbi:putative bacteriophage protein [Salmonella enterica subsp. enterica serovar Typhi]|nr:putative bacteriophage protein [Salmonella enterica subsp. enterica serovar Typhi]
MQQWKAAGARGDQEGQQKLMESFGLAEVFTDIQTVNHLLSMRQGWDKYLSSKQEMNAPAAISTLDKDAAKQNDTLEGRWRRMQIGFNDSAISIGQSLRPALLQLGETFIPLMDSVWQMDSGKSQLVSSTIRLWAHYSLSGWPLSSQAWAESPSFPLCKRLEKCCFTSGQLASSDARTGEGGKLRWLVTGFGAVARGARTLGGVLSGGLVRGIMSAGRAVLWIGRALLMNPIGLVITAVARQQLTLSTATGAQSVAG